MRILPKLGGRVLGVHYTMRHSRWTIATWDESSYPELAANNAGLDARITKALGELDAKRGTGLRMLEAIVGRRRYLYKDNILTNDGMTVMAGRSVPGIDDTKNTHMAIGTDPTAETLNDTELGAEVARKALGTGSVAGQTERYATSFTHHDLIAGQPASVDIYEAGIFNAAADGVLISRVTGSAQTLVAGKIVTVMSTTTHENGTEI